MFFIILASTLSRCISIKYGNFLLFKGYSKIVSKILQKLTKPPYFSKYMLMGIFTKWSNRVEILNIHNHLFFVYIYILYYNGYMAYLSVFT